MQNTISGNIRNKHYMIKAAMEKAWRCRERERWHLLGLDLKRNLLLGWKRWRPFWCTRSRDRGWGTHHCSDKRKVQQEKKKVDKRSRLLQLLWRKFEFWVLSLWREREKKGKRNWWKLRALNSPRQRLLLVYFLLSTLTLGLFVSLPLNHHILDDISKVQNVETCTT